jgi:hypothetical protein
VAAEKNVKARAVTHSTLSQHFLFSLALSFSTDAQKVQSQAQQAVTELGNFNNLLNVSVVDNLQAALQQYYAFAGPLNQTLSSVHLDDWRVIATIVPINIVTVFMMAGVLLAIFSIDFPFYSCFLNCILCPLMFIICAVCWITAGLMLMGAGFNGDFCLPGGRHGYSSPDESILNLMNASGHGPTSASFDSYTVAKYFVMQCTTGNYPFTTIQNIIPQLVSQS